MAWRRPGDKPLSEPMMVRLPTHICVTRPQWVNFPAWRVFWSGGYLQPYGCHWAGPLIFFVATTPIFSNSELCAVCSARFMRHHELWPMSVSHPFSLDNSSGLTGEKHDQEITIPIFICILENLLFKVAFLVFFFITIVSPYFRCGYISVRELIKS